MRKTDNLGELGELLRPILDDPQTMEKLTREAEKLGLGDMLSQPAGEQTSGRPDGGADSRPDGGSDPADMGAMLGRMASLMSGINREDDSTRLLHALRPFLSEKRGKRLDEAGKILMIMRVLKLLRDSGGIDL